MSTHTVKRLTWCLAFLLATARPHAAHAWRFQFDGTEHDRDLLLGMHVGPAGELYLHGFEDDEDLGGVGTLFRLDPLTEVPAAIRCTTSTGTKPASTRIGTPPARCRPAASRARRSGSAA
jgi:hypothetical protein